MVRTDIKFLVKLDKSATHITKHYSRHMKNMGLYVDRNFRTDEMCYKEQDSWPFKGLVQT
jgi:hypothetical protein